MGLTSHQTRLFQREDQWTIEPLRGKQIKPRGIDNVFTIFSAIHDQANDYYLVELRCEDEEQALGELESSVEILAELTQAGFREVFDDPVFTDIPTDSQRIQTNGHAVRGNGKPETVLVKTK